MAEARDRYFEEMERLNSQVYIENGSIVLNIDYEYEISLSRINTAEKILFWAHHLTEKSWMTTPVLRRFIDLAASVHNIRITEYREPSAGF